MYAGAALVSSAINFLALPVFTRVLSAAELGILALLQATVGVLSVVIGMSPQVYLTSQYAALDGRQLSELLVAMLFVLLVGTGVGTAGLLVVGQLWPQLALAPWVIVLTGLRAMSGVVVTLATSLYIMQRRPLAFAGLTLVPVLLSVGGGVYVTAFLHWGWQGRFIVECLVFYGAAMWSLLRTWRSRSRPAATFHAPVLYAYLRYSLPLVVHGLGFWAVASQDRYFVAGLLGVRAAGLYAVAYSIGNVLEVAHLGVHRAILADFYEQTRDPKQHGRLAKVAAGYFVGSVLALLAFALLVPPLVPLIAGESFAGAAELVPWLALGATLSAWRNYVAGFLFVTARTKAVMWVSISGALLNGALNWFLLPSMGIRGAAVATAATYGLMATATVALAARTRARSG
jgi:O-antigen/teichoic acid export membrane protein